MKDITRIKHLKERFVKHFGHECSNIFLSPGRIELLGNHTDHNNGKVLVSSVNLKILAAVAPRNDNKIVIFSKGYKKIQVSLNALKKREKEYGKSIAIVRGVTARFKKLGYKIGGFSVCCDSSIYNGAGVSSSAAFECLVGKILSYYYNEDSIPAFTIAQIAQFSESVYFNKPCGLLDQSGIALGGINYIDFKSTKAPIIENLKIVNKKYQFIIINTGDNHSKLTPCYAAIKDEMKLIANHFGKQVLRQIKPSLVLDNKEELIKLYGERAFLRAKHYFEENERVATAYNALHEGNFELFLKMLDDSGTSSYYQLQNCYVSNEEEKLTKALKLVKEIDPECYSRVHGGGFAGTMLMVINRAKSKTVVNELRKAFGYENVMLVSLTSEGTCVKE